MNSYNLNGNSSKNNYNNDIKKRFSAKISDHRKPINNAMNTNDYNKEKNLINNNYYNIQINNPKNETKTKTNFVRLQNYYSQEKMKNNQQIQRNEKRMSNHGLYQETKKLKSIVRNGKLIYNIDMNSDMQESVLQIDKNANSNKQYIYSKFNKNNNQPNNNNNNIIIQNKTERNDHPNKCREVLNEKNKLYPKIMNNQNNQDINKINTENVKKNNDNFSFSQIKSFETKCNNESKYQELFNPGGTLNYMNEKNKNIIKEDEEDPNIIKNLIPSQICTSMYLNGNKIKEEKSANTLSKFIPTQTLASVYASNANNQKEVPNTLSQFIPNQTLASIYTSNANNQKEPPNTLSKLIPNQTLASVYTSKANKQNEPPNTLSKFIPTQTLASVYTSNANKQKEPPNTLSQFIPTQTLASVCQNEKNIKPVGLKRKLSNNT